MRMHGTTILIWLGLTNLYMIIAGNEVNESCEQYLCRSEVRNFQDYITINTSPGQDLKPAVDFWRRLANQENVEIDVYEFVENYPVIVMKWPGRDSKLKSILLLTHMDVIPACYEDGWTYPPFGGIINEQCEVVGRGAQDMKSGGIQYFEAMRRLTRNNITLIRDVYVVITPDDTSGSRNGIELFVKTEKFCKMNVGFAFDIGEPSPNSIIRVFHQDKTRWALRVDCFGQSKSSGVYVKHNESAEFTCFKFIQSYIEYKNTEYEKSLTTNDYADYTVVNYIGGCNPTTLTAVPAKLTYYFSITLSRKTSLQEFNETVLSEWVTKAGGDIRLTTVYEQNEAPTTKIDRSNPYWVALLDVFSDLNIPLEPITCPTTTDANFVVNEGIPAFGLSPQRNTQSSVFGVNERLSIPTFLEGICIYEQIINRFANIPDSEVSDNPADYIDKTLN